MTTANRKLKLDKNFKPVNVSKDDELFPNGIFIFNITKLVDHINANLGQFPVEEVNVGELPFRTSNRLSEDSIQAANLSNPIVLAEISPRRYNVIDGNHRVEKARREGLEKILAYRIFMEDHIAFLTSFEAYKTFIQYWNSKLDKECEVGEEY